MKKLTFSKIGRGLMVGLLAQVGAGYAADANDHIQAALGGDSPSLSSNYETWSSGQGAQGPIRLDFMDDRAALSAPYAEDAPADRFAYPEDAPGLSATSLGANIPSYP